MDHLKEINQLLKQHLTMQPGTVVFLKPDPTVALFEAQQQASHIAAELHRQVQENTRLQLLRRADYEEFRDREDRLFHDLRAIKIELHSAQQMVRDQEEQLKRLTAYCREQEQMSNNRHKIRGVFRKTDQGDYECFPIVSVGGDAGGLDIYIA